MFGEVGDLSKLPSEQLSAIRGFGNHVIALMRERHPIPKTLFHYTESTGFSSIIQTGVLRATHIGYMNDASEYLKAVTMLYLEIRSRYERESIPDELRTLFDELRRRVEATQPENFPRIFVACFSESDNSLNQWRSYARGDGGFNVGFDSASVERLIARPGLYCSLVPVIYDTKTLRELVAAFVDWIIDTYPKHLAQPGTLDAAEHMDLWLNAVAGVSSGLAALFKDEAFFEEREFRLICFSGISNIKFHPKINLLSAYVDLPLSESSDGKGLMPINEVWAGPGRHTILNRVAAKALLSQKGYDVQTIPVVSSNIAFRVG